MSESSVGHTYYEKMKAVIDPACFVVTGFFGLEKLRSLEWINGPMTHEAMALAGAVNGLTIFLADQMFKSGESNSPYYKAMIALIGLAAGTLVTPYIVSKALKSHAVLITPAMSFRIAAFNLVAKVVIYVAFTKGEQYYNAWNFPAFQDFEEMTEPTVRMLYDHFKDRADLWKQKSFKKQLGFIQALQKYSLDPLTITEIDLETSLTKVELATFRKLYEKGELTPEQATLLYSFHVAPQENRAYKAENLPVIDPRKVNVEKLSDEQIRWHHEWIIRHSSEVLHASQIRAFVPHFYRLDLLPPSTSFVTQLPLPENFEGLSSAKVSYLAHYYLENPNKWAELSLKDQIMLKEAFAKHGLDKHPLREPLIEELLLPYVEKKHLKELKKHFKETPAAWAVKSSDYQTGFNKVLSDRGLKELEIPDQPWTTTEKVGYTVFGVLALIAISTGVGMLAGVIPVPTLLSGGNNTDPNETPSPSPHYSFQGPCRDGFERTKDGCSLLEPLKLDPNPFFNIDPEACIGNTTCTTYSGPMTADQYIELYGKLPPFPKKFSGSSTPTPTPVSETPEYFDSGDQCIPMGTVFQVSTCANPFFNHTLSTQAKGNTTTGASTEQNPVTEEFSSNRTGLTDSGENYPVGFHWPSYEPPFVDDREQLESIDSYEVVYMRKDGVGSGEVDPTVVPSENAASEDFSSVGTGLGDVQEESQHDNSLLGKDIVVEKFDTPTHPIVPCANGYERTKWMLSSNNR
ncbi:hypothetical protein [Simkania sp.]|uniref:hypothetical protein n=1 Tax=Simkania sp. TaxID=34094 RepID=UPI003B529E08